MIRSPEEDARAARQAAKRRAAMRSFMEANDLTPAAWAREANLSNANALYNFLNGRSSYLTGITLERLAKAVPGATVSDVIGEKPLGFADARAAVLPVRMVAALGVWGPSIEARGIEPRTRIALPPGLQADEALVVGDRHCDQLYPVNSFVAVQGLASVGRPLMHGDKVLVHRIRDSKHELTLRELRVIREDDAERAELFFRTHQAAMKATMPIPWPYEGQVYSWDGDKVQVRGRAILMTVLADTMD